MEFLGAIMFSLAVSVDGFVAGLAYGVRKIRIPVFSLLVVALASAAAVSVSMLCGNVVAYLMSPELATSVGAILLMAVGLYFFMGFCRERIRALADSSEPLLSLELKPLGVIVNILKDPEIADFDSSGVISFKEALFLGAALAMDAFGAGMGLAMTGAPILLTAAGVGMVKFILMNTGIRMGHMLEKERMRPWLMLLSGGVLFLLGILEIL
ncbi:MAG: sporulation membrane protein YtaF [Syntrophomonadaceae bacterium]|nr:sporulation membrane protein YtaF [Syntrophomonadaceae bacterium]